MSIAGLTVHPGVPGSGRLDGFDEPPGEGDLEVEVVAVGVCGTDHEILAGKYGTAPAGADRLVLGHESLARVITAPEGAAVTPGQLVVGIVRRPDPVPCAACAAGEWDACQNGRFTERGIGGQHGYAAQRVRLESQFAVPVPDALEPVAVLLEPASVVAKAWEVIERIGHRATWRPRTVLVTGAGPIGLLAALLASQWGLAVHVLDRVTDGPKPDLVRDLGATYHTVTVPELALEPDIVVEATGAAAVVLDVIGGTGRNGVVCLTGVSSGGRSIPIDAGAVNRELVLENDVIVGSVNANRRHYELAVEALVAADRSWLARLITRRVPLERWEEAFERRPGDVKVVLEPGA